MMAQGPVRFLKPEHDLLETRPQSGPQVTSPPSQGLPCSVPEVQQRLFFSKSKLDKCKHIVFIPFFFFSKFQITKHSLWKVSSPVSKIICVLKLWSVVYMINFYFTELSAM